MKMKVYVKFLLKMLMKKKQIFLYKYQHKNKIKLF